MIYSKLVLRALMTSRSDNFARHCFATDTMHKLSEREVCLAKLYRKSAATLSSVVQQLTSDARSFEDKLTVLRSTLVKAESIPAADLLLFVPVRVWVLLLFSQSDCSVCSLKSL